MNKNYLFSKRRTKFKFLAGFSVIALIALLVIAGCGKDADEYDLGGGAHTSGDKAASPTISPPPGEYPSGIQVHLATETEGADIYYTTDGSTPTAADAKFSDDITLTNSAFVRAIAVEQGLNESDEVTANYTISGESAINGTPYVGHTLTANTGVLTGEGAVFQWEVGGIGQGMYQPYTVRAADFHKPIKLIVTDKSGKKTFEATNSARGVPRNELAAYIGALSAGSAASPNFVPLDTTDISNRDNWAAINSIVKDAAKYVSLDLTDCTATDNTIAGAFPEVEEDTKGALPASSGNFNIVQDNIYIKSIVLPSSLESIGDYTFLSVPKWARNLTSVTIPSGVKSIGNYAFYDCIGLTSITIPSGLTSIGQGAFEGCQYLTSIDIPSGVTSILTEAFRHCESLTSITLPAGITELADGILDDCYNLTSVTLPQNLTSIGGSAFSGCKELESIDIPSSVTSIGSSAFQACGKLTGITLPQGLTSIEPATFSGCTGLESITLPQGLTIIYDSAFYECANLATITLPDNLQSIGDGVFWGCESLTSITIPANVTSIGGQAFTNCYDLTSITIPANVTSIGGNAFTNCNDLTSVTFSQGSHIKGDNFGNEALPGNLSTAYLAPGGGAGTYTRAAGGETWTKVK